MYVGGVHCTAEGTVDMKSFSHTMMLRISMTGHRIKRTTGYLSFTWKMAIKTVCKCVCVCDQTIKQHTRCTHIVN